MLFSGVFLLADVNQTTFTEMEKIYYKCSIIDIENKL